MFENGYEVIAEKKVDKPVVSMTFDKNGSFLIVGFTDGTISMLNQQLISFYTFDQPREEERQPVTDFIVSDGLDHKSLSWDNLI